MRTNDILLTVICLAITIGLLAGCGPASTEVLTIPSSIPTSVPTPTQAPSEPPPNPTPTTAANGPNPEIGGAYSPIPQEVCQDLQEQASQAVSASFTLEISAPFLDYASGETGQGCTLTATGTGADFPDFGSTMASLVSAFGDWTVQPGYQADGPTGTATGMARDIALMLMSVGWKPAPEANCPADQPISACNVAPEHQMYTVQLQIAQRSGMVADDQYGPVSQAICEMLQEFASQALAVPFTMEPNVPFLDPISGETGQGCRLTATGTGADFSDPGTVTRTLVNAMLGWEEQTRYQANSPTGELTGMTRDMALMLISVEWVPALEVQCPQDQPISACELTPEQKRYTVLIQAAQK